MKFLILAAGVGKRLRPLTQKVPKCMVKYQNKEIISHILDLVRGKFQIALVTGYKHETLREFLKNEKISFFHNENFKTTNMLRSLFCAKEFLNEDIIISYSDIIYTQKVLDAVLDFHGDFGVVVDKNWKKLWLKRMEDPLSDAESLKIKDAKIYELGKKVQSYDEIEAQYIGLIKISKNFLPQMIDFYENLDRQALYEGKDFDNMYMTSFIQALIDRFNNVEPIFIYGNWCEIDCMSDLKVDIREL